MTSANEDLSELIKRTPMWSCKIGVRKDLALPPGCDAPMRRAVHDAFVALAGTPPDYIFSGWGSQLDEYELAVVENRLPSEEQHRDPPTVLSLIARAEDLTQALEGTEAQLRDANTALLSAQARTDTVEAELVRYGGIIMDLEHQISALTSPGIHKGNSSSGNHIASGSTGAASRTCSTCRHFQLEAKGLAACARWSQGLTVGPAFACILHEPPETPPLSDVRDSAAPKKPEGDA